MLILAENFCQTLKVGFVLKRSTTWIIVAAAGAAEFVLQICSTSWSNAFSDLLTEFANGKNLRQECEGESGREREWDRDRGQREIWIGSGRREREEQLKV